MSAPEPGPIVTPAEPEPAPFLPGDLPHWAARALATLLILLVVGAALASVVIRVPDTVSSAFTLVPAGGVDPVRTPRDGVVAAVRVAEGQVVAKGDPLVLIRSALVGERSAELGTLETRVEGARQQLGNERARHESQGRTDVEEERTLRRRVAQLVERMRSHRELRAARETKYRASLETYQNEVAITQAEIGFKREHLSLARELADRFERYQKEGLVSWLDATNRRLEANKLAVEIGQLDRQLDSARLKISQLRAERDSQETEWRAALGELEAESRDTYAALEKLRHQADARQSEHRELERRLGEESERAVIRITALRRELLGSRGNELTVASPCAGTLLRLRVRGPGAVVHDGDVLGEVACAGERLQAELTVPQTGVARLAPGQTVKLLYDAFPYQRFGVKYGTVRWVSPASVMEKDGAAFRALVDLQDETVRVDGRVRPLAAGMGGRAQVLVGRRSLMSFAVEPLRQLRENLSGGPAR